MVMEILMNRVQWNIFGIILVFVAISVCSAQGQEANLSLSLKVNENLANSQSVNIQSLISRSGKGPNLFRIYLNNENTSDHANDLYFDIIVQSDKIGRLAHIYQVNGQPFSLTPGQKVFATNNNINDGLPGVDELIEFDGDLTPEGQEFINGMKGSTDLPPDRYSVVVNIYQGSNQGRKVASATAEVGMNIVENTYDFYLLSPGNVIDSDANIANPYPNFQWQGVSSGSFRLMVVEAKENESPQSLLKGAASTEAIQPNSISNEGSLVNYEMLDVNVNQSNFQYPSSGVQELESGQTYYWRVIAQRETSSGEQTRGSEIWSFTLANNGNQNENMIQAANISQALESLIGNQLEQIIEQGYSFDGMQFNGQNFQGGQAIPKLMELNRRAEAGDISIVIENQ